MMHRSILPSCSFGKSSIITVVAFLIICISSSLFFEIEWTKALYFSSLGDVVYHPQPVNFSYHIFDFGKLYYEYFLKKDAKWKDVPMCAIPQQYQQLIQSICWDSSICGSQIPCSVFEPKSIEVQSWRGDACVLHEDLSSLTPSTHVIFPEGDWLKVTEPIFQSLEDIRSQPQPLSQSYTPGIWMFWLVWENTKYYAYAGDPVYVARFNVTVGHDPKIHKIRQVIFPYGPVTSILEGKPDVLFANKTDHAPAVMMISNCNDKNDRLKYAEDLMKYMKVDSYGACMNNMNISDHIGAFQAGFWDYKRAVLSKYHFTLAFENTNTLGYLSEKLWNALGAGTIPVYMGAPDVDDFLPTTDCIINTRDFPSPQQLAEYLNKVLNDTELYKKYKEWYKRPLLPSFIKLAAKPRETSHAQAMCSVLHSWGNLTGIDDTILKK